MKFHKSIPLFTGLFFRFSIRQMAKYPGRALIVFLGISLGAAVFTSVRLSVHASLKSFNQSMEMITGSADRSVTRPGGRVPETLLADLLKLPFVKSASPLLFTYVQPPHRGNSPFLLIGIDPILDRPFREWQIQQDGRDAPQGWLDLIKTPYSILVGQALADDFTKKPGDFFVVEYEGKAFELMILDTLLPGGLALVEGGRVAIADIATFQEFTGIYGKVDRIDLLFESVPSENQMAQIRDMLPSGVFLTMPHEDRESGQAMISAYQLNLSVLSFVSLFVGMFLVYSLVALNAASRRKELAILRSTGASAGLIFCIFITEGGFLGLVGWLMAIPASSLITGYMLHGISETISTLFVRVSVDELILDRWELVLSFFTTIGISVLAALQPAREAMKVNPKEALMIGSSRRTGRNHSTYLAIIGLLAVVIVFPLSHVSSPGEIPLPGYLSVFVLFVGFSMFSPRALEIVGKVSGPIFRKLGKEPAWLAGCNIRDSGVRTAIPVSALITAVALFSALVIMVHSFRGTVELWTYHTVSGDLFVRSKLADINRYKDPMPQNVVDYIKSLDNKWDMDIYRRIYLNYGKHLYQFEALQWDVYLKYGRFFWIDGDPVAGHGKLKKGEGVLVSEVFANRTGLSRGSMFRASIQGEWFELPIIGIIRDYRTQGGVVYYSLKHYQDVTGDLSWGGARIFFRDRGQNLEEKIIQLRNEMIVSFGDSAQVTLGSDLRETILKIFDDTFTITTVLLLIALLVAALGITSALTVLVLERSRELNTIFAIGGSFGQIRAMIFWEAFLLVFTGKFLGFFCGLILSYLLVFVINKQSFGWTFLYRMDWSTLLFSYPIIIAAALSAAIPAIRLVFYQPPASLLRE